jgi:predicted anti-sigma-YlaC factor YlaD
VNCIQAQAMLAAYRDLKNEEVNTLELDVHLEQCASCRQVLARYSFIGEQIRSLPIIEPPPEAHDSLMRALAKEQLWYIQQSASSSFRFYFYLIFIL